MRITSLWLILIFFWTLPSFGQIVGKHISLRSESSLRQHADSYFERNAFSHAAKLYNKIILEHPDDQELQLRLADCYRMLREPHSAEQWYRLALKRHQAEPEHLFSFASVLCATGKYQEATNWFTRYLALKPSDQRALAAVESLKNPQLLFDSRYEVQQLPIEIPGAVFSPVIFNDGLVFVGEGATGSLVKKMTTWIEGPYFDLYYVPLNQDKPGFPKYLDDRLNSVFHEGPATFFDGGNKVIITRSAFKKGQEDTRNLQLMIAERKPNGTWTSPKKLFHHQDYSIAHPAITQDGKVLYFSSDKPGGFGGSDLYRSELVDGQWTDPVNAGPQINTSGNELFPSLDADGTLFFSSDGHGGLGGLEIFRADLSGTSDPVNLGYPINSPGDDFGLVWHEDANKGYFSTDRSGQDRIFRFERKRQLVNAAVPVN